MYVAIFLKQTVREKQKGGNSHANMRVISHIVMTVLHASFCR